MGTAADEFTAIDAVERGPHRPPVEDMVATRPVGQATDRQVVPNRDRRVDPAVLVGRRHGAVEFALGAIGQPVAVGIHRSGQPPRTDRPTLGNTLSAPDEEIGDTTHVGDFILVVVEGPADGPGKLLTVEHLDLQGHLQPPVPDLAHVLLLGSLAGHGLARHLEERVGRAGVVQGQVEPDPVGHSAASMPASIVDVFSGFRSRLPGFAKRGADWPLNELAEKVRSLRKAPGNLPV